MCCRQGIIVQYLICGWLGVSCNTEPSGSHPDHMRAEARRKTGRGFKIILMITAFLIRFACVAVPARGIGRENKASCLQTACWCWRACNGTLHESSAGAHTHNHGTMHMDLAGPPNQQGSVPADGPWLTIQAITIYPQMGHG